MLKYLTVLSLTACVLLNALWVRSYSEWDQFSVPVGNDSWFAIDSVRGQLCYFQFDGPDSDWNVYTRSLEQFLARKRRLEPDYQFPPNKGFLANDGMIWVPHWFPVVVFAVLATAPWIGSFKRRFSLRTLLIATTLVAVVLGIVVAAT